MKNRKNIINESVVTFKKIDKVVSKIFLYYTSICGFIFGWVCIGIILLSMNGSIPTIFTLLLRIFYFLISFLLGLKFTIFMMKKFKK